MSTFRNPVGPQPASVYWRRRAVVGLGILAVLAVIILIIVRPGSEAPTGGTDVPTVPGESASPEPGASDDPTGDPQECNPAVVSLEAVTDKNSYSSGENPKIGLSIVNNGAVTCLFNVGTSQQELRITSGNELYWTSKHCQTDEADNLVPLEPGVEQSTQLIEWDRTRSASGSCSGDRPKVPGGGASYHLTVKVGDLESAETKQFLLN